MKKAILICLAALAIASCATPASTTASYNARKVEIGMTEREVIRIMGRDYDVVAARANTRTLVWGYNNDRNTRSSEYRMVFVDGKLHSFRNEQVKRSYRRTRR